MPATKQINPVPQLNNDTGFSTTGVINGSRFINRDGTFNLHKNADTAQLKASFDQGILTITIPDREPETRKIEIL